jgi:hypothetical protein
METRSTIHSLTLILYQRLHPVKRRNWFFALLFLIPLIFLLPGEATALPADLQQEIIEVVIVGRVVDSQGVPILDAEVLALTDQHNEPLAEAHSQEDGT